MFETPLLKNGNVAPKTRCPFRFKCSFSQNCGEKNAYEHSFTHPEFLGLSCGAARAFDLSPGTRKAYTKKCECVHEDHQVICENLAEETYFQMFHVCLACAELHIKS